MFTHNSSENVDDLSKVPAMRLAIIHDIQVIDQFFVADRFPLLWRHNSDILQERPTWK